MAVKAGMIPEMEELLTSKYSTSTEIWLVGAPHEKCEGSPTVKVFCFPHITDLYRVFRQVPLCVVIIGNHTTSSSSVRK